MILDQSPGFQARVSRRTFLAALLATGGVPSPVLASSRIEHVVLMMQENRSFDHYFGTMPGVDGLKGHCELLHHAGTLSLPDTPHSGQTEALIAAPQLLGHTARSYYRAADVPVHRALAARFTLCDNYRAAVPGGTFPNRLFSVAATAGTFTENPASIDPDRLPKVNLVDRLNQAGLDWACYQANRLDAHYNQVAYFPANAADPRSNRSIEEFFEVAAAGRLPPVSWVVSEDPLTEHPPASLAWGERLIALVAGALQASPAWNRSALIIHYDEPGGFFDHRGLRVPCLVISPYARRGYVSHRRYDHASVLAWVERNFGLAPMTAADAAADPLSDCFDMAHPDPAPADLRVAPVPDLAGLPGWAAVLLSRPIPGAAAGTVSPPADLDVCAPTTPWWKSTAAAMVGTGLAAAALAVAGLIRFRSRRAPTARL